MTNQASAGTLCIETAEIENLEDQIRSACNCAEAYVDAWGSVWISDPQRGHWLTQDEICGLERKLIVAPEPAPAPLYRADQYDSVYERNGDAYVFVGKLNGRTLDEFIADNASAPTN